MHYFNKNSQDSIVPTSSISSKSLYNKECIRMLSPPNQLTKRTKPGGTSTLIRRGIITTEIPRFGTSIRSKNIKHYLTQIYTFSYWHILLSNKEIR
jgi:hypothetical protein